MLYNNILETIGGTPLIKLNNVQEKLKLIANIYAKVEYFNPGGSVKDRAAYFMLKDYLERGLINRDTTLIEPTSGNTGIGLAMVCAALGLNLVITMPESMSKERRMLIKAYGAKLILTDAKLGMKGAIAKANDIKENTPNAIIIGQFVNFQNVNAHYQTTAVEIHQCLGDSIDYFVAGIGTGGTITGCAKYFKEKGLNLKIIGVEPEDSPFLTKASFGPHKIQGIGAGFKPEILETKLIDNIMTVSTKEAYESARLLAKCEGILVGISSGAALSKAIELASDINNKGKNIVVVLPDNGERYLTTDLYEE